MRRALAPILLLSLAAAPACAADLQLAHATLASGGVGQFDFTAEVDGAETLALDVPLDQVDDLLKSLRVDDPVGGAPLVRLAGQQPLSETFKRLPFQPQDLASNSQLLAALVGSEIRLPDQGVSGRVMGVENFNQVAGTPPGGVVRHRLSIATDSGMAEFVLEDIGHIDFPAASVRTQIADALRALAENRAADRRRVEIVLGQGGKRRVGLSIVVAAPVWKASYRMVLPQKISGTARLVGDAVVENLSGRDWQGIGLTLTSGQPVLYRQNLYQALFNERPVAPIDVPGRVQPRRDEGAVPMAMGTPGFAAPPAPALAARMQALPFAAAKSADAATPSPATTEQEATQVAFTLAQPITAAAGQTLLLPLIDRAIPARRVALYQPDVNPTHPLVAVDLTNDSGAALPPGLATLTGPDERYIGDARLPAMQSGDHRLASFAVDLPVLIDRSTSVQTLTASASAAAGTLHLVYRDRQTTTYRVVTPPDSGRALLIEQPRLPGWTLAGTDKVEVTPTQWRIARDLPAGATTEISITAEQPRGEALAIGDLGGDQLVAIADGSSLSDAARAALRHVADRRAELDRARAAQKLAQDRAQAIVTDQNRIRQNLGAVPRDSELARTYLSQLTNGEHDLAALRAQADAGAQQAAQIQASLADEIAHLTF